MTNKGMSGKDYFSLAFGSMIGIGWVVSVPLWIANAGTYGAMIAMFLTALIVIPIGLVYGELSTSVDVLGGEFAYTYIFLGRFSAFTSGWFLIFGYITILPWVALSVSSIFSYLFPGLKIMPLYKVLGYTLYLPEIAISLIMIWSLTFVNLKGIESSKAFQNFATGTMILTFIVFFIGNFLNGNLQNLEPKFIESNPIKGISLAIASMLFFMNGFDTIPKTLDEKDKEINPNELAKAIVGTIIVGSLIYIAIIFFASLTLVPGNTLRLGDLPLVAAYETATGSKIMTLIVLFGVLLGVTTTFNGFLLSGSKLVAYFARSGFISKKIGVLEDNIAKRALISMAVFSTISVFLGKGLLAPLINLGGLSFMIAWFYMALSNYRYRISEPNANRPFEVPGGKAMILIAVVISGLLSLAMIIPGTLISMANVERLILVVWSAIGLITYFIYKKQDITISKTLN